MSKASIYFTLGDIDGKHDVRELKKELVALPGVLSVSASDDSNRVAVDFDTTGVQSERISRQLEKMGYEVIDSSLENHVM